MDSTGDTDSKAQAARAWAIRIGLGLIVAVLLVYAQTLDRGFELINADDTD